MADALQPVGEAIVALMEAITVEAEQIAAQVTVAPADVASLVDSIRAATQRVKDLIPDAPVTP